MEGAAHGQLLVVELEGVDGHLAPAEEDDRAAGANEPERVCQASALPTARSRRPRRFRPRLGSELPCELAAPRPAAHRDDPCAGVPAAAQSMSPMGPGPGRPPSGPPRSRHARSRAGSRRAARPWRRPPGRDRRARAGGSASAIRAGTSSSSAYAPFRNGPRFSQSVSWPRWQWAHSPQGAELAATTRRPVATSTPQNS